MWRFNETVTLTLTRKEATEVHDAIVYFMEGADEEAYEILHRLAERMKQQIEHKPSAKRAKS